MKYQTRSQVKSRTISILETVPFWYTSKRSIKQLCNIDLQDIGTQVNANIDTQVNAITHQNNIGTQVNAFTYISKRFYIHNKTLTYITKRLHWYMSKRLVKQLCNIDLQNIDTQVNAHIDTQVNACSYISYLRSYKAASRIENLLEGRA